MDARRAAQVAEDMTNRGYDASSIAEELSFTADAEQFGWIGAKYAGVTAGIIPDEHEWAYQTIEDVRELLSDKKTVSMAKLREALGEDE